jgi:glucokinase
MGLTVGVDIGGTKIAAGVVDERGQILARARRESPATDAEQIEVTVADLVRGLAREHSVDAVGIGAAGFVDRARSTVLFAPNLAWRDEPLKADLERRIDLPVVVENDANAAAWGEFAFGAGADVEDLLLVTVGTGVGGGIVLGGELHRGSTGVAAEIGHVRVVPDGRRCGCGNLGCWEQYASGTALVRNARESAEREPSGAERLLKRAGGVASAISGPMITDAAREGDRFAISQFEELAKWLGDGIATLVAVLDPAVVAIGGGVAEAGDVLMRPARARFSEQLSAREHRPEPSIRTAQLGNDAGLIGAADLARRP